METRAHYILIGLSTLAAGIAVLLFVMWMTGSGGQSDFRRYDVLFREAVSGLSVGSPVQYSGIRVGEVEGLELDLNDPRMVWARVRISGRVPISAATTARLTLLNITGASGIELSQEAPGSPLLDDSQGVPIIEAEPSSLSRLRLNSEELLLSVTNLVDRANLLFSDDNAQRLGRVIDNLDTVTTAVAQQQGSLQQGLQDLASAGAQLNTMLQRLDGQALAHAEPMLLSASNSLDNLERFTGQLNSLLDDNRQSLDAGMQSLSQLEPAMSDLRSILTSLSELAARLEEDPAGLLFPADNIREYRP